MYGEHYIQQLMLWGQLWAAVLSPSCVCSLCLSFVCLCVVQLTLPGSRSRGVAVRTFLPAQLLPVPLITPAILIPLYLQISPSAPDRCIYQCGNMALS